MRKRTSEMTERGCGRPVIVRRGAGVLLASVAAALGFAAPAGAQEPQPAPTAPPVREPPPESKEPPLREREVVAEGTIPGGGAYRLIAAVRGGGRTRQLCVGLEYGRAPARDGGPVPADLFGAGRCSRPPTRERPIRALTSRTLCHNPGNVVLGTVAPGARGISLVLRDGSRTRGQVHYPSAVGARGDVFLAFLPRSAIVKRVVVHRAGRSPLGTRAPKTRPCGTGGGEPAPPAHPPCCKPPPPPYPGPARPPDWAPAEQATVHPGVATVTAGQRCTAGFLFYGQTYTGWAYEPHLYLVQPAHCGTRKASTAGCTDPGLPVGTPVEIEGASRPGSIAYHSWSAMRLRGESDPDVCAGNDLAFVEIDRADWGRANPSVPIWGGPTAAIGGWTPNEAAYAYGPGAADQTSLRARRGVLLFGARRDWTIVGAFTIPSGADGDGSPVLTSAGDALGLSSGEAVDEIGALGPAVNYAWETMVGHGGPGTYVQADLWDVRLAAGTEPFAG